MMTNKPTNISIIEKIKDGLVHVGNTVTNVAIN